MAGGLNFAFNFFDIVGEYERETSQNTQYGYNRDKPANNRMCKIGHD
jgi:hypothetical protein